MKKTTLLMVLLLAIFIITGCGQQKGNNEQKSTAADAQKQAGQPQNGNNNPSGQEKIKTYTNLKYHFTFDFPNDFYVNKGWDYQQYYFTHMLSTKPGDDPQLDANDVFIYIKISRPPKEYEIQQTLDDYKNISDPEVKISLKKELTINSLPALQQLEDLTNIRNNNNGCALVTYIERNKLVHQISLSNISSCAPVLKFKDKYDIIVNSFKFTE